MPIVDDHEDRLARLEAVVEHRAARQEELERVVETVVRHLEAGCRLVANGLHDLPVLDRRRADREADADRRGQANRRNG